MAAQFASYPLTIEENTWWRKLAALHQQNNTAKPNLNNSSDSRSNSVDVTRRIALTDQPLTELAEVGLKGAGT